MFDLMVEDELITVYEHADAELLIADLAMHYGRDVKPVSRGGRGRNRYEYYNYCCSFDIETTTIRSGQLGYYRKDGRPLGFPYLYQWNIYGAVIMVRTYEQAGDIFRWLGEYFVGHRRRKLVIFDHNLSYEFGFCRQLWELEYQECFAIDIHHPVTLVLKNGLVIKDSYKLSNMGLETLTKDWSKKYIKKPEIMDYSQTRTPYTPLDADTLIYSALDVLGLSDAISHYLKAQGTGAETRQPTSTSFIRVLLKKDIGIGTKKRTDEQKHYFETLEAVKLTPDLYAMHLRQARGGNTHQNRRYTGAILHDLGHMDITSSYPTQGICYPEFAIGAWAKLDEDCSIELIKRFEAGGYTTLFDIVLINPRLKDGVTVPYLATYKCRTLKGFSSYSDNGRYLRGAQMLETTIFGIELSIILDQYDIDDAVILRGYYARKGYLPDIVRRFMLKQYEAKTTLKGVSGQEVEYALAKARLNGIYGMMFTQIVREKCAFDEQGIFMQKAPDPADEMESFNKSPTRYFVNYSWGAMIATLGRVYLQKLIDACGDDFIYCDTDSVFYTHPEAITPKLRALEADIKVYQRRCGLPLVYNDMKGNPHELGGIDEEDRVKVWRCWGAKKYVTVTDKGFEATIAGVPKYIWKDGQKVRTAEAILKTPEAFELGAVFKGRDTNKLCLWYNSDEGLTIYDEGRPIRVHDNIAMLPVDYILGLSDDYSLCLQIEGVNEHYAFEQLNVNHVEDFIN